MKVTLLLVGKTSFAFVKSGEEEYSSRIKKYVPFAVSVIESVKNAATLPPAQLKIKEGELILKKLAPADWLVLLDENGEQLSSRQMATTMSKWMDAGKNVVLVIGGAYGFSDAVYQRANQKISLSKMTFSHQLVRVLLLEQLYRALTILRGEPYHHD